MFEPFTQSSLHSPCLLNQRRIGVLMYLAIGAWYLGIFFLQPQGVFWSPDEGNRLLIARSLTQQPSPSSSLAYPGFWFDPDFKYYPNVFNSFHFQYPIPLKDGKVQYPWSIIFPWIAGIFSKYLGQIGLYLVPFLSGLGVIFLSWQISKHLNAKNSYFSIPIIGLSTPILFFSFTFWDHTLATFFGLAALLCFIFRPSVKFLNGFLGFILLGIAILIRTDMAIWGISVGLGYFLIILVPHIVQLKKIQGNFAGKNRKLLNWIYLGLFLIIILVTVLIIRMNWIPFPQRYQTELNYFRDSVIQTGLLGSFIRFGQAIIRNLPGFLINIKGDDGPSIGSFWNLAGFCAIILVFISPWIKRHMLELACVISGMLILLGLSVSTLISTESYRSMHGIFLIAPLLPMASYAVPAAYKSHNRSFLLVAIIGWFYLFFGTFVILVLRSNVNGYWPGLEWGNRYLLTLYPVLSILGLLGLENYWSSNRPKLSRQTFICFGMIAIILGINLQFRGLRMLADDKLVISSWQTYLIDTAASPVVTSVWWFPASLATYFTSHEMYSVPNEQTFLGWLRHAWSKGVSKFTFVGQTGWDLNQLNTGKFKVSQVKSIKIYGLLFIQYRLDAITVQ
jgi:hypothetical protein